MPYASKKYAGLSLVMNFSELLQMTRHVMA